jgi:hypothetical protein
VPFEILGDIHNLETIATGHSIRVYGRLVHQFGRGNWRKMKGTATVRLSSGRVVDVELHWYEAHGVGKRRMKIKRYLSRR